jgi:hypothetical protein
MAGLLDIFGTGGTNALSLLGGGDIQSARDDAQAQALYALAGRMFQGGNTGASIAQGLQLGQQAYKQAMQSELQDRLQTYQLQEYAKKKQEEEAAKKREALAQQLMMKAYQPARTEVTTETPMFDLQGNQLMGPNMPQAARPAGFDIASVAPSLMGFKEGRAVLGELAKTQEAMMPKYQAVGDVLYKLGAEGPTAVAGSAKGPTSLQEFLAAQQNPAYAAFLQQKEAAKAPKIAVDLKDPTAVAKAQSDLVKDWRAVVKDSGAPEVADRFKAAQVAVNQGNAGNKAADGALIYAIGKIYDPSGAVQEGDKATILGNRSIPDSIKAYAQKAFSGQDLLPTERAGLLSVASKIVEAKAKNLESQKSPYTSLSKQLGGSGDLLMNPLSDALTAKPEGDIASAALAELERRRKAQ